MSVNEIINEAFNRLDQEELIGFANHIASGEVSIPSEIDRKLLRAGRNHYGRYLDDEERKTIRRTLKKLLKIQNLKLKMASSLRQMNMADIQWNLAVQEI